MKGFPFYHAGAVVLPDGSSYPIWHFTEELRKLAPEIPWTIIGKPLAMLDADVAQVYGKQTRHFNQQVEQNLDYFKPNWRYRPTPEEWKALKILVRRYLRMRSEFPTTSPDVVGISGHIPGCGRNFRPLSGRC